MSELPRWKNAPDAWRMQRRFSNRYVNLLLRTRSATAIPDQFRHRILAMNIPPDIVHSTLRSIRSVHAWAPAWIESAQALLNDYRRMQGGDAPEHAERLREAAAMCFHVARLLIPDDPKTAISCQSWSASLFSQVQPALYPFAHRVQLPWRTRDLSAWYMSTDPRRPARGLVVLLNDATTTKEELFGWSREFLRRSIAVVAIDSPGTGESSRKLHYAADQDDLLDGVFELAGADPTLNPDRVVVMGIGIGGNQAVRVAARDRRVLGCIAVTPSVSPSRWIHRVSPLLRQEVLVRGDLEHEVDITTADAFDLGSIPSRLRCPALIFGAARDLIVPPAEAQHLAATLGARASLIWHEDGGHGLFDRIPEVTSQCADWVLALVHGTSEEGIYDGEHLADYTRRVLT